MNKKNILILMAVAILSACQPSKQIEFNVTASGLTDAVFYIKSEGQQTIFGENIKDGKCIAKGQLDEPGFYDLDVVKTGAPSHLPFKVYLEPGKYTVTIDANKLAKYPKIETTSPKQQEINNYYETETEVVKAMREKKSKLNSQYSEQQHKLSKEAFVKLLDNISKADNGEFNTQYQILETFVKKYPQSELSAYFMARQNYTEQPEAYYKLFTQLSPAAKGSDEGKEVEKRLNTVLKLQPGKPAPEIAGKTFDGKTFSAIKDGKKMFLIDFWKSANQYSREKHADMKTIYEELHSKGFEIISVSLDSKPLWWTTAVKDDKLPWPQMSDLKGNDSPNAEHWNLTTIPTYYLVDGNWNVYKRDIQLSQVKLEATQYLDKHH